LPEVRIPYTPHPKQAGIHSDPTRFKIIAAGRRFGKTVLAINELIRVALENVADPQRPTPRSWYVCDTYKHAEMIAWKEFLRFLPPELIKSKNVTKLQVELINGHLIEFKGSEDPDKLRGVGLVFVVMDEYGQMKEEVWTEIIRPALMDSVGTALFIGTPGADGSPHFYELWKLGQSGQDPDYKSWLCFTTDNPNIDPKEIATAKRQLDPAVYKREYEADFTITAGLVYDNFRHVTHVIPHYEPSPSEFIVGSIDPGLYNPTAALLTCWTKEGTGIVFKEYYEEGRLAGENAQKIYEMAKPYKVAYWVIDRSSTRRDPASGITVFGKYQEYLKPLLTAPNDKGSVWAGIDEVKKLFHIDPLFGPKLRITVQCHKTIWELGRYIRYKHKWMTERNNEEKPRKMDDHAMDALRNVVMTRPWLRLNFLRPISVDFKGY